jgi:hypothetical protein
MGSREMPQSRNPFEYDGAINLSKEEVLAYYIEDFNFSRFLRSKRNIFLLGERGSGKTMALLYNSLGIQLIKEPGSTEPPALDYIGVYIPCNSPILHKEEQRPRDDYTASVLSNHFLSLAVAYHLLDTLALIPGLSDRVAETNLVDEIGFLLDIEIPDHLDPLSALRAAIDRENILTQRHLNSVTADAGTENAFSFPSLVLPIIAAAKRVPMLSDSHFMLLFDDVHDLDDPQIRILNSWIGYRDRTHFSIKVAMAKRPDFSYLTSSGSSILEGHDFTLVDMEHPFTHKFSNFEKLAHKILRRRLQRAEIEILPADFFPEHPKFAQDLERCREAMREEATSKYGAEEKKKIADYVYKYARAEYFRRRPSKANLPAYAGFQTLVYLSTGVVRNLLNPCYWMYEQVVSDEAELTPLGVKKFDGDSIRPEIQNQIIHDRSQRLWERLLQGYENIVEECSKAQAQQLYNLFDQLAVLFKKRLIHHRSEPRANSFTVSAKTGRFDSDLLPLFEIARQAQLLYIRTGVAKDRGRREFYYVPNRMLWPARGLDPHGQHARVSIKERDLVAALDGEEIPYSSDSADVETTPELF